MRGNVCIRFIDFMLKRKSLLGYTNLFYPNEYGKNNKIKRKYFQQLQTKTFFYGEILKTGEEKITQKFRMKNIEEKNFFLKK